jgi:antitoxin VapB
MMEEIALKLEKVRNLLVEHHLDALLLRRVTNFAWMTAGASSYVNTADNLGTASLLITPDECYLLTNNIEATRLRAEENLEEQGWQFKVTPWYRQDDLLGDLTANLKLGTDSYYQSGVNLSSELVRLRMNLLPQEQDRFVALTQDCATAMNAAIHKIEPGMSEFEIAAVLNSEAQRLGLLPIVNLVATDERVYAHRHPLPTAKELGRYAMLVLCGRRYGLVGSITRLIHFGPMPADLRRKAEAVAEVDAALIHATRPGTRLGDIFSAGQDAYARLGFKDEWQLHHQGGPAGYLPRETVATPNADWIVREGQVHAWNPSIAGTKSEDTILVTSNGNRILTEIPDWPLIEVAIADQIIARPATLEII